MVDLPLPSNWAEATARCPRCGEVRMVEYDPALRVWVCGVCSTTWQQETTAS